MDQRDLAGAIVETAAAARREIVDPSGRPARAAIAASKACPSCGAGKEKRVLSAGFGAPHDLCGVCGHAFDERTIK